MTLGAYLGNRKYTNIKLLFRLQKIWYHKTEDVIFVKNIYLMDVRGEGYLKLQALFKIDLKGLIGRGCKLV